MKPVLSRFLLCAIACPLALCLLAAPVHAQSKDREPQFNSSGLKLPRFVSISAEEAHVRAGPATRYPIKWVYKKRGLPVEIVQEFDVWRKIKDQEGDEGWVHKSLLSDKRNAIILGEEQVAIRSDRKDNARTVARFEPGVIVTVAACQDSWCDVTASGYEGWVERKSLWGIYATEEFD